MPRMLWVTQASTSILLAEIIQQIELTVVRIFKTHVNLKSQKQNTQVASIVNVLFALMAFYLYKRTPNDTLRISRIKTNLTN